jgi:hypothetical protein
MPSLLRGSSQNAGNGTTVTVTVSPSTPTTQSYVLIAVGISTATNTVTGITGGTGTFARLTSTTSANRTLEMWIGYNFGNSAPTSFVITRTSGTADMVCVAEVVDVQADVTGAPAPTASTANTATSNSADCGALTPAVGDLMFADVVMASTSADSTARTHTGNTYMNNGSSETGSTRVECGWGQATAAVSSTEVWTLGSSVEWAARQVIWTPAAAPAAAAALVVKGLDTAALDAASSF